MTFKLSDTFPSQRTFSKEARLFSILRQRPESRCCEQKFITNMCRRDFWWRRAAQVKRRIKKKKKKDGKGSDFRRKMNICTRCCVMSPPEWNHGITPGFGSCEADSQLVPTPHLWKRLNNRKHSLDRCASINIITLIYSWGVCVGCFEDMEQGIRRFWTTI